MANMSVFASIAMFVLALAASAAVCLIVWAAVAGVLGVYQAHKGRISDIAGVALIVGIIGFVLLMLAVDIESDRQKTVTHDACQERCGPQRVMACDHLSTGNGTLIEQPWYSICAAPDGGLELRMESK